MVGALPDTETVHEHRSRGLDHGGSVPLKVMYPDADVPVLELSIPTHASTRLLILGARLRSLREHGVLVVGSGFMTHGLPYVDWRFPEHVPGWSREFDLWAADALARGDVVRPGLSGHPAAMDTDGTDDGARWLTADEMATWLPLTRLLVLLPSTLDGELREDAGISHVYYQILAMLSDAPDRQLRMGELARMTATSLSRLSHAVSSLEGRGWVQRCPSRDDRRGQLARLTEAGFETLRSAAPGHVAAVRRHVFDHLDAQETRQLGILVRRLTDRLTQRDVRGG